MSLLPPIFRRGEEAKPLGQAIKQPARRVLVQHAPGWSNAPKDQPVSFSVTYCVPAGVSAKELRKAIFKAARAAIAKATGGAA